jgi:ribosomal-protein-alanine N-acetyltransferase
MGFLMAELSLIMRLLKLEDLLSVYNIERVNFDDPWSIESIEGEIQRECSYPLGIFQDESLIAYSFCWIIRDEMHLLNFSVKKEFQGKGLGKKMLSAIIGLAKAKKCKLVHLEVSAKNTKAINLYQSHGFKSVGRRKAYYQDYSDAILMTLQIAGK